MMMQTRIKIDDMDFEVEAGLTVQEAAQRAGIYIPALCSHPDLPSFDSSSGSRVVYQGSLRTEGTGEVYRGCRMCLVEIEGDGIKTACNTFIQEGMTVRTNTPEINERRQENMKKILSSHPHTCLVCPQMEGCGQKSCISNVPENERCCAKFNVCELRKVAEYVGMRIDITPYVPQGLPVVDDEPLFRRDYNLCISCTRCVRVCNEVRGVGALTFTTVDGDLIVGTIESTLKASGCKFCGACVEVCPTGALMDKAGKKKNRIRLQISAPIMPPDKGLTEFNARSIQDIPKIEGVFRLFDADKRVICIKGTMNLFEEMNDKLRSLEKARYFNWEEDPMYSKRENELLQQYIQQYDCLPEGNAELDDDLY
jgi:predicted molibdopterin-dependent oxidoreductase YjgC